MTPVALTIAGSDPSGGAGLQADLKTFHQFGLFGTSVVTLLTVQNTQAVRAVEVLKPQLVLAQLEAVLDDLPPGAAKTGALGSAESIQALAHRAAGFDFPLVVDPVMVSKHGALLLDRDAVGVLRNELLPKAFLVTPNRAEASLLAGIEVLDLPSMEKAAVVLARLGPKHVLVKGGDVEGDAIDVLWSDGCFQWFSAPRIDTQHTHGSGCVFSAAITALLALGHPLQEAIGRSKRFVTEAILSHPQLGKGLGPINMHAGEQAGTRFLGRNESTMQQACAKPTVALVSTERNWGGGEEQARLLAEGLRGRGIPCVLFAREDGRFAARMSDDGFEVVPFFGKGRGLSSMRQIRRHLFRVRPDVLHGNDSHALSSAGLASLGLQIPARIAARRVVFPLRSTIHYRWFTHRVVCVSRAVAEVCRQSGLPADLIRVVYDGVDPARAAEGDRRKGRAALNVSDRQPLLLTVAKLTDCKGHTYLLDALPAVVKHHPGLVAALAGDGELADRLRAQAARLGIDRHLRFLGYRRDVPDLIQAADVFVLPSHTEGLCSTLIDVMLAGRPIVASSAGGIPELLGDEPGETPVARCVPPRDSQALASAILDALENGVQSAQMATRACERARRRFTADGMVEATLAVYREVLSGSRGPQPAEGARTIDSTRGPQSAEGQL